MSTETGSLICGRVVTDRSNVVYLNPGLPLCQRMSVLSDLGTDILLAKGDKLTSNYVWIGASLTFVSCAKMTTFLHFLA